MTSSTFKAIEMRATTWSFIRWGTPHRTLQGSGWAFSS